MNSPFGKKMSDKNPISVLQQNAFYVALNDAKEKGKNSFKVGNKTFNVSDSAATMSPYHKHKKLEKKLEKAQKGIIGAEQGDKDYELIASIKKEIKEAKAAHDSPRTQEDNSQIREDEDAARGAAAEMAPLKKNNNPIEMGGYVGGGMSASDYASTADLYQNMFDKVEGATKEFMEGQAEKEKDSFNKVGNRIGDVADAGVDYKFGQTLDDGLYAVGNKGKKENAFQKYTSKS